MTVLENNLGNICFLILKTGRIKLALKEFQENKKKVLKLIDLKKNKKLLDEFSFLNQNEKKIKRKNYKKYLKNFHILKKLYCLVQEVQA